MLRVLIVDDSEDLASLLMRLLAHVGYECRSACDGPQALKWAGEFTPHVVLLDLGLPGADGYAVAHELRDAYPSKPLAIIAMSGAELDADRCQQSGIDHHLQKPAGLAEVLQAIKLVRSKVE